MSSKTMIAPGIKRIQFDSFDSWLKARHGIGGSDASAVLGLNPYKTNTDLYLEKTGQRIAPDISDKDYVKYGRAITSITVCFGSYRIQG